MMHAIIRQHKNACHIGICSVCSAHPLVIEAALRFDLHSNRSVLIEATSNQVNQFGGYTGMTPEDFRDFVYAIAADTGFPQSRLILGGDHLGPNCWQHENAQQAMEKAEQLIATYVQAGFRKIHLDASMSCADDPVPLPPETIAERAARLCAAAEAAASPDQRQNLSYIIGTEVPVPGGESHAITQVHVTCPEDAAWTIESHRQAFLRHGLEHAFTRVAGLVVQPGVEFDHSSVVHYQPEKTQALTQFIRQTPLVYEAHSTDYQTPQSLRTMVRDGFAILKVGPALTFAMREAIFSLAQIEQTLIPVEQQSHILAIIDSVMLDDPKHWERYYDSRRSRAMVELHYSLSDRIRYYWPEPRISAALDRLIENLNTVEIPVGMLSQYFPLQLADILSGNNPPTPRGLIINKIQDILRHYAWACDEQPEVSRQAS